MILFFVKFYFHVFNCFHYLIQLSVFSQSLRHASMSSLRSFNTFKTLFLIPCSVHQINSFGGLVQQDCCLLEKVYCLGCSYSCFVLGTRHLEF